MEVSLFSDNESENLNDNIPIEDLAPALDSWLAPIDVWLDQCILALSQYIKTKPTQLMKFVVQNYKPPFNGLVSHYFDKWMTSHLLDIESHYDDKKNFKDYYEHHWSMRPEKQNYIDKLKQRLPLDWREQCRKEYARRYDSGNDSDYLNYDTDSNMSVTSNGTTIESNQNIMSHVDMFKMLHIKSK